MGNKKVLIVGSAKESAGGVSSVIKLMEKMPVWKKYNCFWLGTQIQRNYLWKLWYAMKGNVIAFFIMWRFQIVHMHTTPDKLGLLIQLPILLWAKVLHKKVIMHLHVGNQLKTKKNSLFVYCLKKADLILLLAKKWETLFGEYYPEVNVPTNVLYNACEIKSEVSFEEKQNFIMMAAFYCDNKAPDLLLKAWQMIEKEYPDWTVILLGNGELERYKEMASQLGIDNRVSFPGYMVGKEHDDYFRKASIYCMCSYEEGFPMVVLESWMYGINVVTTPVGGLPDVLEDGHNALVFDFGDYRALAKCLISLIEDKNKRRVMAEYSRKFVADRFSLAQINSDWDNIYLSL